ncbi:MAG TPA: hypothetical protein VJ742_13145 [Nitrososphaera sp.]|nr:hypothetical protein [Nitrososphaera sp.]
MTAVQRAKKKSSAAKTIPEELQSVYRQRLALLRNSRGLARADIKTLSPTIIGKLELHDISTLKLGDIVELSTEFGLSPAEFMQYILTDEGAAEIEKRVGHPAHRASLYIAQLPAELQELACNLIQELVDFNLRTRDTARHESSRPLGDQPLVTVSESQR